MGQSAIEGLVTIMTTIVVLGIVAVLVSRNSQTSGVLAAGGKALSGAIGAAVSPVSGANNTTALGTQIGNMGGIFDSGGNYLGE